MVNCNNCGSQLMAGAKFCENCGMGAVQVKEEKPKHEEKKHEVHEKTHEAKPAVPMKIVPKWFVITSLVLSFITAIGIGGLFIPVVKDALGALTYASIFLGATVGLVTLFYIFMLIFFLAKQYGHGSKLIPVLHLILYVLYGAAFGVLAAIGKLDNCSNCLSQSQIAMALLGGASGVSFVMLCVGLYFLLREAPST